MLTLLLSNVAVAAEEVRVDFDSVSTARAVADELATHGRRERLAVAGLGLTLGVVLAGFGTAVVATADEGGSGLVDFEAASRVFGWSVIGLGAANGLGSASQLVVRSQEEKLRDEVEAKVAAGYPGDAERHAEQRLAELATREARERKATFTLGLVLVGAGVAATASTAAVAAGEHGDDLAPLLLGTTAIATGAGGIALAVTSQRPGFVERVAARHPPVALRVAPLDGGVLVGWAGRF